MATKAQNGQQPYGLTDELVDSLLHEATTHNETALSVSDLYCSFAPQQHGFAQ